MFKQARLKWCFIVILACTGFLFAQGASVPDRCQSIDTNKHSLSISYERSEATKHSSKNKNDQYVWLRLHNDTNCTVLIETDSFYPSAASDGKTTFDLQDGAEIGLAYNIQDSRHKSAPKRAILQGCEHFVSDLPAGRAVIFPVPVKYFKKHFDVVVPFVYESEGESGISLVGSAAREAYFYSASLPRSALAKRN